MAEQVDDKRVNVRVYQGTKEDLFEYLEFLTDHLEYPLYNRDNNAKMTSTIYGPQLLSNGDAIGFVDESGRVSVIGCALGKPKSIQKRVSELLMLEGYISEASMATYDYIDLSSPASHKEYTAVLEEMIEQTKV